MGGGHELILPANDRRVHILDPEHWGNSIGTDYHAFFGESDEAAGGGKDLSAFGWESSGFGFVEGSGADFLDVADVGVPGGLNFDTADDYLISPFIFGDYDHARAVQELLGHLPTQLVVEVYARFASAGADEQATGFGLVEAGSTGPLAKADTMVFTTIGATNFELHSGAAADEGSAKATTQALFKTILTKGGTAEWFIDNVSQGTIAIQTDLWPAAFAINTQTGGTNDPVVSWVHIWYN